MGQPDPTSNGTLYICPACGLEYCTCDDDEDEDDGPT